MWARLEEALIDHEKIFKAGSFLGKDGPGLAIGLYTVGLLWSNSHLTEGYLPKPIVQSFRHFSKPLVVADALTRAALWDRKDEGFQIHDYGDWNKWVPQAKEKRAVRLGKKR